MRILIYGINYAPELTGIGKYTGEMAEWLASQGHQVRVVTAPPYYPAWQVEQGYSAWSYRYERLFDVEVWRCPLWVPHKPSSLKRILHLASFAVSSLPVTLWQGLFGQPDIIFVVEPSFFCLPGALLAAKLGRAKTWLHIQDFELDAAFELGLLSFSKSFRKVIGVIERWFMSQTNCVSTISENMLERLASKRVNPAQSLLFPNWVDVEAIFPMSEPSPLRSELGISAEAIVLLYSGSMGKKQGLEILICAAQQLLAYPNILFAVCGVGGTKKHLLELAKGLPNICFLDLQPIEKLNSLLNFANIHLLIQSAEVADLVMPSKLLGMFASGRPVIATANPETQVAKFVDSCGLVVPPGDVKALVDGILYLASQPEKCAMLGRAAQKFAVNHWHQEKILSRIEQVFWQLTRGAFELNKKDVAAPEDIATGQVIFAEADQLQFHVQAIAKILHNTSSIEDISPDDIEQSLRRRILEYVSPHVAVCLSDWSPELSQASNDSGRYKG